MEVTILLGNHQENDDSSSNTNIMDRRIRVNMKEIDFYNNPTELFRVSFILLESILN